MLQLNILGLFGFLLFGLGISLLTLKTNIEDYALKKLLILHSNSPVVEFWKKFPVEIPTTVYFFNWTNKEDFYNLSLKPKFEQVGPYKFKQSLERFNVTWNDENNTVTFKQAQTFRYDEDNKNLSDKITTIDYLYMATAHYIRYWSEFVKLMSSNYLESLDLTYYITKTAAEHSLDGFESPIMTTASYISFLAPEFPIFDKFGWIKIVNSIVHKADLCWRENAQIPKLFEGGEYFKDIFTLSNGKNRNFDLVTWNYENKTKHFDSPCNEIRGSLGDLQTFTNKSYIEIFIPQLCRYVHLDFEKEEMVNEILGHKYSAKDRLLDNGTKMPDNKCFGTQGSILPSGVLNISSCHHGFNGYISLPHFYGADPFYLNKMEGLKPQKSKHETFVIVEPQTFLPLRFVIRAQLNMHVHSIKNVNAFENAPDLFFPIFWNEQSLDLPEPLKTYLGYFLKLSFGIFITSAILIFLGIFFMVLMAYKYNILSKCKSKEEKSLCRMEESSILLQPKIQKLRD